MAGADNLARINSCTYFRKSKVVILVYDITNRETFDSLTLWERDAVERSISKVKPVVTVLVGNKLDMEDKREVTHNRAAQFAENYRIPENLVFEISAKTGHGVRELFEAVAKQMQQMPSGQTKQQADEDTCSCTCTCL